MQEFQATEILWSARRAKNGNCLCFEVEVEEADVASRPPGFTGSRLSEVAAPGVFLELVGVNVTGLKTFRFPIFSL